VSEPIEIPKNRNSNGGKQQEVANIADRIETNPKFLNLL